MSQPLQLRLTVEALNALFPEGSTARVELQSAVMSEFVRKSLKPNAFGEEAAAQIDRARGDALAAIKRACTDSADNALRDVGVKAQYGSVTISGATAERIHTDVRRAVHEQISEKISALVATATDKLRGTIEHDAQAAVNRMINAEIAAAVKAKVFEVMKGLA